MMEKEILQNTQRVQAAVRSGLDKALREFGVVAHARVTAAFAADDTDIELGGWSCPPSFASESAYLQCVEALEAELRNLQLENALEALHDELGQAVRDAVADYTRIDA